MDILVEYELLAEAWTAGAITDAEYHERYRWLLRVAHEEGWRAA